MNTAVNTAWISVVGVEAGVAKEEPYSIPATGPVSGNETVSVNRQPADGSTARTSQPALITDYDDHALLAATKAGEEQAFEEIVRRYRNQITNYINRMLGDYDRAIDLTQETFVRVYMNVDRYQATFSFSTYIYRIAHNLAISELRQRKRRRLISLVTTKQDTSGEEMEIDLPDEADVPADEAMISDERRSAVTRAIASLPEKYRAPLVLCDLEEKSYEEISEILDLPSGTVKSRINRARGLLREKLKDIL